MIDLGANRNVMPKTIVEALKIEYEALEQGIMRLDGKKVQGLGIIRNLPLTLYSYPSITSL